MPKQVPAVGDVFLVELSDGGYAIGQVLETRPVAMNSITCAFFDKRVSSADEIDFPLAKSSILSCQCVTRDAFNQGQWKRVLNVPPGLEKADLPHRDKEHTGWVGAKVI